MRPNRLIPARGDGYFHVVSRVVDKRFIFNAKEKNHFRKWMRKLEAFLGVQVVTYCLMSNHFHLLLRVPDRASMPKLTVESLLELLPVLYSDTQSLGILQEIERAQAARDEAWLARILERFERRRFDLSIFVRELKQRFTRWYNRTNNRRGTLWEDRFKSVLVEGSERALMTIAAYIDLNPIRAGLVKSPEDYRWCGYAEAVAGKQVARRGLKAILEHTSHGVNRDLTWEYTAGVYRVLLFGKGLEREADAATGAKARRGFSAERIEAEEKREGRLSIPEILRCRVRYFCDGAVFGTVEFVNSVFEAHRGKFSAGRRTGARRLRGGADWGELRTLRDLQITPVG
ncbi:MAG: transposase [Verrucomicrobiales bacterium]|nr:transposase [Verrucomicrobiales bacterium]